MKNIFIYLACIGLFACNPDSDDPEVLFKRKIDTMEMESFKIPDSINTSLIAATYFNSEFNAQSLIVYNDSTKKSATKIDYQKDTVITEPLTALKRNEFSSIYYPVDYVIGENSVNIIHRFDWGSTPPAQSKEFRRTDRD